MSTRGPTKGAGTTRGSKRGSSPVAEGEPPAKRAPRVGRIVAFWVEVQKWFEGNMDMQSPDITEAVRYQKWQRIRSVHHANAVLRQTIIENPSLWWKEHNERVIQLEKLNPPRYMFQNKYCFAYEFEVPPGNPNQEYEDGNSDRRRVHKRRIIVRNTDKKLPLNDPRFISRHLEIEDSSAEDYVLWPRPLPVQPAPVPLSNTVAPSAQSVNQQYTTRMTTVFPAPGLLPLNQYAQPSYTHPTVVSNASTSQGIQGNELGLQEDISGTAQGNLENMPRQRFYIPTSPATPGFANYGSNQETQSVRPSNTLDDDNEADFVGQPKMPDPNIGSGTGMSDELTAPTAPAAQPFEENAVPFSFDDWVVNESEDAWGGIYDEPTGNGDN
ncbi:hypothetical protein BJ508DRAFT_311942 [Ascobolus immersus RN42]|uniref:Uncharacterized protein n=1 Tax=Ascobolus immersus RN42 TaxID=1160509 RepID=A0A3N4HR29_ASCIM|nr:hypothetical protein BJ508DRAFT_311942 [Ascobolus immersus RN42]